MFTKWLAKGAFLFAKTVTEQSSYSTRYCYGQKRTASARMLLSFLETGCDPQKGIDNVSVQERKQMAVRLLDRRQAVSRLYPGSASQGPGRTSGSQNPRFCLRGHVRQTDQGTEVARLRRRYVPAVGET